MPCNLYLIAGLDVPGKRNCCGGKTASWQCEFFLFFSPPDLQLTGCPWSNQSASAHYARTSRSFYHLCIQHGRQAFSGAVGPREVVSLPHTHFSHQEKGNLESVTQGTIHGRQRICGGPSNPMGASGVPSAQHRDEFGGREDRRTHQAGPPPQGDTVRYCAFCW